MIKQSILEGRSIFESFLTSTPTSAISASTARTPGLCFVSSQGSCPSISGYFLTPVYYTWASIIHPKKCSVKPQGECRGNWRKQLTHLLDSCEWVEYLSIMSGRMNIFSFHVGGNIRDLNEIEAPCLFVSELWVEGNIVGRYEEKTVVSILYALPWPRGSGKRHELLRPPFIHYISGFLSGADNLLSILYFSHVKLLKLSGCPTLGGGCFFCFDMHQQTWILKNSNP